MAREFEDWFCGCTDGQLADEIARIGGIGEYDDYIANQRTQHTLRLQRIHKTGPECSNPVLRTVTVESEK